ncbi:MAG: redoxin family protein [Patescibacteria group bacterium]
MKPEYIVGGIVLVLLVLGVGFLAVSPGSGTSGVLKLGAKPYQEIVNPSGFVNTEPFMLKELVGKKVILVDFMTYSCINCQRTFPYLNAWYETYKDRGLEIVGIHTPEFAFERDIGNVREAMERFGIKHRIVLDNDYATWRAYGNQYWPRKYLVDIHGNIVYDHIGEGAYEETEMKIRELLEERERVLGMGMPELTEGLATESVSAETSVARSPETYFGSLRNEYLANGTSGRDGVQTFALPATLVRNALYLAGSWNIAPEYAESVSEASIVYRYNAKEVYIVAEADTPVEITVLQDGKAVGASGGVDVSVEGIVKIGESRLYKLVKNGVPGEHLLELKVSGPGARFYAFTFG